MLYAKDKRWDKPACLMSVATRVTSRLRFPDFRYLSDRWEVDYLNIILRKHNKPLQLIFKWSNTGGRHYGRYSVSFMICFHRGGGA